jgi:5-methylcytosine-specific restriction endonuclease McrA
MARNLERRRAQARARYASTPDARAETVARNKARAERLRAQGKLLEVRKRYKANYRKALQAKGLTSNGTVRKLPTYAERCEREGTALSIRNARDAWWYWLRVKAPKAWLDAYYAVSSKPWGDHRLNESEKRRVRYAYDAWFRGYQQRRLAIKKRERRAQIAASGGLTYAEYRELLDQACVCTYCSCPLDENNRTLDHVVPLSRGGAHDASNLVAACRSCNSAKQDRIVTV